MKTTLSIRRIKKQSIESEKQQSYYVVLIKTFEQKIKELEYQNSELLSENNKLKEKLNTEFDNQQMCIEFIKEIAKKKRERRFNKFY